MKRPTAEAGREQVDDHLPGVVARARVARLGIPEARDQSDRGGVRPPQSSEVSPPPASASSTSGSAPSSTSSSTRSTSLGATTDATTVSGSVTIVDALGRDEVGDGQRVADGQLGHVELEVVGQRVRERAHDDLAQRLVEHAAVAHADRRVDERDLAPGPR